jgi:hypothetical protein
MKKGFIFLMVLVSTFFLSCSSDDNSSNDDDLFLKINVNGTEFNSIGLFSTGFGGEQNCSNNGDLFLQYVGQVENSNMFIECNFVHFENDFDFDDPQKNIVTNTRLTDVNDLWEANYNEDVCSINNDFSIVFEDKLNDTFLRLKPNTNKTHNITNVQFVSEDATSKFYIIEGNFNAMFLKGNIDVQINGNYRIKIEVYK